MTTPTANVPHRFSEKQFRRYEPHIATVVRNWPGITRFKPTCSIETFSCRFRDAIRGLFIYRYITLINYDELLSIRGALTVAQKGDCVVIGPKLVVAAYSPTSNAEVPTNSEAPTLLTNPPRPVLEAFCLLLSGKYITTPLIVTNVDATILLEMQDRYDVVATEQPDGSTIII